MSIYEKHIMSEPRLPFIFHSYNRKKRGVTAGVGNWHENVELLCFTKGSATVTSNELRIEVTAGDIAVINPNCLHDIFAHEETHFYCIIVDRSFCLANHFDTNLITFSPKIRDGEIYSLICDTAAEYAEKDSPYAVQTIRADILKIMSLLCRRYSEAATKPQTDTHLLSSIKLAIGFISNEYYKDISLDLIAEKAGLSKYYLAREFHRITGYTIVNYVNVARCEKAKRLLSESNISIENIARSCGFPNASYFSKTFKKHIGILPSEYREKFA
jgi:AraC-like DNA-binding protein